LSEPTSDVAEEEVHPISV